MTEEEKAELYEFCAMTTAAIRTVNLQVEKIAAHVGLRPALDDKELKEHMDAIEKMIRKLKL